MKKRMVYRIKTAVTCIMLWLVGSGTNLHAQQEAIYSQYMFNPFMINPAYAGSRNALSGVLLARKQWVGMDGAPSTETFSIHNSFLDGKMAAGLNLYHDAVGPTSNIGIMATYAYHLKLGSGKLAFGLRGGLLSSKMDATQLSYNDPSDHFNTQAISTASVPSFDFGVYYYTRKAYIGFSASHLTEGNLKYVSSTGEIFHTLKRHYMLMTGWAAELSPKVVLKPSVLVKYVSGAPVNVDLNVSALFNKIFWVGVSYRSFSSLHLIAEFNVTSFLRVGYSFELPVNRLKKFTMGTHEVFVGFDLNLGKSKHVSPRYL
jgi:type IX secretion system PorP/SprF family membrane protein